MFRHKIALACAAVLCGAVLVQVAPIAAYADGDTAQEQVASEASPKVEQVEGTAKSLKYSVRMTASSKFKKAVTLGKTAGKESWKGRVSQLRVAADDGSTGNVTYAVRKAGSSSWGKWVTDGKRAGSKGKTIDAVKIKLSGSLAKKYNVYYRVYSNEYEWLGWAKNGQAAGTGKIKLPVSAIQIELVKKGEKAPGSTKRHYTTKRLPKGGGKGAMFAKAQYKSSSSKWLIMVNRNDCWVGVFKGKKNNWKLVRYFRCSTGKKGFETPSGTFKIGQRFSPLKSGASWEYYAIRVTGAIHFHSVLYYAGTHSILDGTLGKHISKGCIRCPITQVKWMYKNLPDGTTCNIYYK